MIEYKTATATQNLITETFTFSEDYFGTGYYPFQKSIDLYNTGYYINLLYYGIQYTGAPNVLFYVNLFSLIEISNGTAICYDYNYPSLTKGGGYVVTRLNYIGLFDCTGGLQLNWDVATSVIDTGDKWIGFIAYTITKQ